MEKPSIRHTKSGRRLAGFTLVELLIAMGIIVMLMGLLMPVIQQARLYSLRITCQGNVRAIANACVNYATDSLLSRGTTAGALPNTAPTSGNWSDLTVGNAAGLWLLTRHGYATPSMFLCPEAAIRRGYKAATPDDGGFSYIDGISTLSYSYISMVGDFTFMPKGAEEQVTKPFRDLTNVGSTEFATSLVIIGDQNPRTTFNDDNILTNEGECSLNHRGTGQNVGAMDLTAQWLKGTVETETGDDVYAAHGSEDDSNTVVRGELEDSYLLP